ncbi:MAG: EamA family transporter [Halomonas sp.]|uniref:DMT family transporter n=1 Tax=Halomonas sp. 707B3 TaxID=1681043 RepID=UPI000C3C1580|nr:DMT family transporter [Halomonas sp. 707B3]MAP34907.1 EamA family transporter [Halomonas sp.]MCP1318835.1 DMT family transporter [Halomonas sp. 707B3]|tara:strand:- start:103 stop:1008 length:906 start_codon:yes stop_codon:yes gene_type:complete
MSSADALRLLLLSSLWGLSFIFMRVAAPEFGAVPLVLVRMGIGALLLVPLLLSLHYLRLIWQHKGPLLLLGIVNHVLPFSLLALATTRLEAGFTSLINATTPIFTALLGAAFFATPVQRQQYVGLALALLGVYVLSANRLDFGLGGDGWFIIAVLGATFCYGIAGNYSKTRLSHLPTRVLAAGSSAMSALVLLIPGVLLWPSEPVSTLAWGNALALAMLSTTLAFLLYFGLLASAGATATSTVTFLVPVSALLWGYLLLDETLSLQVVTGMVITLLGTAIATKLLRFRPRGALPTPRPPHE